MIKNDVQDVFQRRIFTVKMRHIKFIILIATLTLVLVSCLVGRKLKPPDYYYNPQSLDTDKIRFDGLYRSNIIDSGKHTASVTFIVFHPNNKIVTAAIPYDYLFDCNFYKNLEEKRDFGLYTIKGDSIFAFDPTGISMRNGSYMATYNLNFSGYLKSDGTIEDWHAVPPYPSKIRQTEVKDPKNERIFIKQNLAFVPTEAVKCIPDF